MRIAFADHRGMAAPFLYALAAAGHTLVPWPAPADALLCDFDGHPWRCDPYERVILYPHGAGIVAVGDGQWPVHPHTRGMLVNGPGHVEILKLARYPRRVAAVGWALCRRLPFRPCRPVRVLLAPEHETDSHWVDPRLVTANARVHDALADMPGIELTVRFVLSFETLGIRQRPGVKYVQGQPMVADAVPAARETDCVVGSAGTFPTLAVAQGTPTIMYGQVPPHDAGDGAADVGRHEAKTWQAYWPFARFPLDADDAIAQGTFAGLLQQACATDADIAEWRDRFVGRPMDPAAFAGQFAGLAADRGRRRWRRGAVRAI